MLKIRLSRRGKKRQPSYRVVVTEAKFKRDGRYVERIGWFNPLTDPETYLINEDRALYWLSVGAQPTDAVKRLLKNQGTLDRLTRMRKGESLEALVAEYEGVELDETPDTPDTAVESDESNESDVADVVEEETAAEAEEESVLETIVEKVEETAEAVAEKVEEAVEAVQESVSDVVETVTGDDAEDADDADAETA